MKFKSNAIENVIYDLLKLAEIFCWSGAAVIMIIVTCIFAIALNEQSANDNTTIVILTYLGAFLLNTFTAIFLRITRQSMLER